MAYNKKTWISNEIISKNALNNIENGIEAVEQSIPKKISQLENDAGYITEHLDLSNYAEKDDLHEHNNKDVLDEISLVRMQAWDNAALNGGNGEESVDLSNYATKQDLNLKADRSELFSKDYNDLLNKPTIPKKLSELENDTNFITLEDVPACLITEEEKEAMNNRVKALEEVEHVSLEQYNTLLNRIALLEKALNDLKSENPEVPDDPDPEPEIPDNPVNVYSVTNNLTNVSTNNSITSIEEGQSYNATLTCGDNYDIYSVVVTMDGVDITNSVYDPEEPTT